MNIGLRLRLIEHWNLIWKKWSVRFTALGVALYGYLLAAPDAIIGMWSMLPEEFKSVLPVDYAKWIPFTLFVLGLLSQYVKQQKLENERKAQDYGKN